MKNRTVNPAKWPDLRYFTILLCLVIMPTITPGQDPVRNGRLKLFLDCESCDEDYIRQELIYVDYVRDRQQADVHVFSTSSPTGGEGRKYTCNFIGQERFAGLNYQLIYDAPATATADEQRQGFMNLLRSGLMPYLSQTPYQAYLTIDYSGPGADGSSGQGASEEDNWNSWVFVIKGGGQGESERAQDELQYEIELEANRITEAWKIRTKIENRYESEHIRENGKVITSPSSRQSANGLIARSVGAKLAIGISGEVNRNTDRNINLGVRMAPAIEYNLFPYAMSERKLLTFTYRIGPQLLDYREETIFEQFREFHTQQSLKLKLDLRQPWGRVQSSLEGSHYLYDSRKNHLTWENDLEIRLFEGLALWIEMDLEAIHDQLNIPMREITLEELLLKRRELLTNYKMEWSIGLSYTFGSIYNSVVNPRL